MSDRWNKICDTIEKTRPDLEEFQDVKEHWPKIALSRPVAKPVFLELDESGYILDPEFDYANAESPSFRKHYDYDTLCFEEKLEFLKEYFCFDDDESEAITCMRIKDLRTEDLHLIEEEYKTSLDEDASDYLSFHDMRSYSIYWIGDALVALLKPSEVEELGLYLHEGDGPESSFSAWRCKKGAEDLNVFFTRKGLNVRFLPDPAAISSHAGAEESAITEKHAENRIRNTAVPL